MENKKPMLFLILVSAVIMVTLFSVASNYSDEETEEEVKDPETDNAENKEGVEVATDLVRDIDEIEVDGEKLPTYEEMVEFSDISAESLLTTKYDANLDESNFKNLLSETFVEFSESVIKLDDAIREYAESDEADRKKLKSDIKEHNMNTELKSGDVANLLLLAPNINFEYKDELENLNDDVMEATMNVRPIIHSNTENINVSVDEKFFAEEYRKEMLEAMNNFEEVLRYLDEN